MHAVYGVLARRVSHSCTVCPPPVHTRPGRGRPAVGSVAVARVVVIGAGVGGLCAAVRLAAAGHRLTVCEAAGAVGGKLGLLRRN
ncbi:MAG TPA: NAD(P)-binding protein, partial [Pseudonocardiaceae bacterium]|nr:NAD(P)-binding protein [Pseudonocardiaceae bacterium]